MEGFVDYLFLFDSIYLFFSSIASYYSSNIYLYNFAVFSCFFRLIFSYGQGFSFIAITGLLILRYFISLMGGPSSDETGETDLELAWSMAYFNSSYDCRTSGFVIWTTSLDIIWANLRATPLALSDTPLMLASIFTI